MIISNISYAMHDNAKRYHKQVIELYPDSSNQKPPKEGGPDIFLAYQISHSNGSVFK